MFYTELIDFTLKLIYFSVLKFWDTRNLKSFVTQACPHPQSTEKVGLKCKVEVLCVSLYCQDVTN